MVVAVLGSDGRVYQKNSAANGTTFPAGAFGGGYPANGAINDFALTSIGAGTRIAYTAASC